MFFKDGCGNATTSENVFSGTVLSTASKNQFQIFEFEISRQI